MQNQNAKRALAFIVAMVLCLSVCCTAFAKYNTIPYGEESDAVRSMQKALKSKGFYRGSVDGKFGKSTRSAVYRYQKSIGLKADGKPGNKTLTALYEGTSALNAIHRRDDVKRGNSAFTLYYGCTGNRVKQLQRALKEMGYFSGSADGKYGDMTELAVRKYQTAHGLHVDGMAGRTTLASINKWTKNAKVSGAFLLSRGSQCPEVKSLQLGLRKRGYTVTDVNGVFGETTESALRAYQQASGQSVTGTMTQSQYNTFIDTKTK